MKKILLISAGLFFGGVMLVSAHQPYILDGVRALVSEPEVSKVYYGKLDGVQHVYFFTAEKSFPLYVNLLVPKTVGAKTDFSFEVKMGTSPGSEMRTVAEASGVGFNWQEYFEEFARDSYFKGPEYRADAPSGYYEIIVQNPGMGGRYAIAIGEEESFPIYEMARLLVVLPRLKKEFFDTSPLYGLTNIVGVGVLAFLLVVTAGAIGIRRLIVFYLKKMAEPTIPELLGKPPETP